MKSVRVRIHEALLERLDQHPTVREHGRSAILREAVVDYLERWDAKDMARRYSTGYQDAAAWDRDFRGWTDEGAWPEI